jgi:hypothetical protein|tara:strand:+ start:18350 stop:19189 length:840 start_codon:yes stop_codon:yes gene_type:complete
MKLKTSKKTAKDYYVDPDAMWTELDNFYTLHAESDDPKEEVMSPELGRMIDDIATKLGFMSKFINYSYKEEMQGDARLKMVKAVYDVNFTLWRTLPCTELRVEGGRDYVILHVVRINKEEKSKYYMWDDKKTYLKPWDSYETYPNRVLVDDLTWVKPFCSMEVPCTGKCKCNVPIPQLYDVVTLEDNPVMNTLTFRNNPFSYFTKIAYHAFVNRIKKEKKVGEVLHAYQEKIYEDIYASGNGWENVKRQKIEDEEDYYNSLGIDSCAFYNEENEQEFDE